MSRTPRRTRHPGRHGSAAARAPRVAPSVDPVGGLRGLVEEGIVLAAALNARDDLDLAAASTARLGALTSGMWRALSRELETAAERLDRSALERMEAIERRARALQVDAEEVVAAGVAAMHLAEHRETLETLIQADEDRHRLLGPEGLFGYRIDAGDRDDDDDEAGESDADDDDDDDDDDLALMSVRVTLLLWAAPLTPATVTIGPSGVDDPGQPESVGLALGLAAPAALLDALSVASGLSAERVPEALSALAVACWTAHHLDDQPPDDFDADDEEGDDDVEKDGGRAGGDGV